MPNSPNLTFDKAYINNEVTYHKTVNDALQNTLIPGASNSELKNLLTTGLKIFQGHLQHAEQVAAQSEDFRVTSSKGGPHIWCGPAHTLRRIGPSRRHPN